MPKGLIMDTIWKKIKEKMRAIPEGGLSPLDKSKSIYYTSIFF